MVVVLGFGFGSTSERVGGFRCGIDTGMPRFVPLRRVLLRRGVVSWNERFSLNTRWFFVVVRSIFSQLSSCCYYWVGCTFLAIELLNHPPPGAYTYDTKLSGAESIALALGFFTAFLHVSSIMQYSKPGHPQATAGRYRTTASPDVCAWARRTTVRLWACRWGWGCFGPWYRVLEVRCAMSWLVRMDLH